MFLVAPVRREGETVGSWLQYVITPLDVTVVMDSTNTSQMIADNLHCMTWVLLCHSLHGLSYGPLCMSQQILNGKTRRSLMHTGPCLTLRAIFSLIAELGPEFFRGKHWVSVMSSSANRMLKGTVRFPRVHLCLSSFTCALRQKRCFQTSQRPPTPGGRCYETYTLESMKACEALPPPRAPASWGCGQGMKNSLPTKAPWSWTGSWQGDKQSFVSF